MLPAHFIGIVCGLTSAIVWGGGDFMGGLAARRTHQFQVVVLAAFSGAAIFLPFAILLEEPFPSAASLAWSAAAGVSGAVGIAAFVRTRVSLITVAPLVPVLLTALGQVLVDPS